MSVLEKISDIAVEGKRYQSHSISLSFKTFLVLLVYVLDRTGSFPAQWGD